MNIDLSADELFLIEMALDQVLYMIKDTQSPIYTRYHLIDKKIYSVRKLNEDTKQVESYK